MKYFISLLLVLAIAIPCFGADMMLNTNIERVISKTDRNGNPYTMLIVPVERQLEGVAYTDTKPLMVFSDKLTEIEGLKEGDAIKAIVSFRTLKDGRESYTLIKIVKK